MKKTIQKSENSTISRPELLVPAGDFDCVRAAVQNGADCVYFGATAFSARANAKNFSQDDLKNAIEYCKIRNVKTNLTLNTLLTDKEFDEAIAIAKCAYDYGIDAIIVQDLGLGKYLIDNFPGMDIHASTQMSVHNLEGVLELQSLGFSRVVLSREVPINEIEYIRNNCSIELEVFVHGALCISYSGQCLFSSLTGGRSGNRGKCAQPCRLPYELLEVGSKETLIDKGYLLSPKDLCSLEYLPKLIDIGINSFKIEGRMKTPEYVATVTRIYRKYIDKILCEDSSEYSIDEGDKKALLQVFNRGGFSEGHLNPEANLGLIYPEKPNNMGLYLGNISNYNSAKGHISLKLNESLAIGDCIGIDGETGTYTVSELMKNNVNLKFASNGEFVKIGRMKGNIRIGSKVYKLSSKELDNICKKTYSKNAEIKKIPLSLSLTVKKDTPIKIMLKANTPPFYNNICVDLVSNIIPEESKTAAIDEARIKEQFSKLGNTPFVIEKFSVDLDENLHISSIGALNELRRTAISTLQEQVLNAFRKSRKNNIHLAPTTISSCNMENQSANKKISILLSNMDTSFDYSKIDGADNVYIPLKFWTNKKYSEQIFAVTQKFNTYIYMPTIIKPNYKNLLLNNLDVILKEYNVAGFVISNISGFMFLKDYISSTEKKYQFVANYTMNVFNLHSIDELKNLGTDIVTPSIELNKPMLQDLCTKSSLPIELIAYGRLVLMNCAYCLLGKSTKCYPQCSVRCSKDAKYYLKDRLGLKFRVVPDNIQTVTSIYNSKITSIDTADINVCSLRIDILDENVDEINSIINTVKSNKKLNGKDYTNGNLNREI